MTKSQLNKWARNNALASRVRLAPETAGIAAWPTAMAAFDQAMEKLRAVAARQAQPVSESVLQRDLAFQEVQQKTLAVAGVVLSYATTQKLPLLAKRVGLRPGVFRKLRAEQKVMLAQMVHDVIEPVLPQLAAHGLTSATLAELQAAIDAADATMTAPRDATVSRRAATEELRNAFRAVDAVIENHFDPLLRPLQETHPEFYEAYRAARRLVNRPGTRDTEPLPGEPGPLAPPATPAPDAPPTGNSLAA